MTFYGKEGDYVIYFDNSATTEVAPEVLDTYLKTSERFIGNPSSLHHLGEQANVLLAKARQQIAHLMSVDQSTIYFTSGGTEANNWVLKGTAIAKRSFGKHLIISAIEHPSVIETAEQLTHLGYQVSYAPVDQNGVIDLNALIKLIRPETILISVMVVNNEIGTVQPIQALAEKLLAFPTIHFHVDAVQSVGYLPFTSWFHQRIDFATFSAHKFHGPRGVGWLYWKKGCKLASLLTGGGQENNQRSGTENVAGIVAAARALRITKEEQQAKIAHVLNLQQALIAGLSQFPGIHIFSPKESSPHIICFGIKGIKGEVVVHALEEKEIYVSTTSACSSRKKAYTGTLSAIGLPAKISQTAIRLSLCEKNTMVEVTQFLSVLHQLYNQFRKINGAAERK